MTLKKRLFTSAITLSLMIGTVLSASAASIKDQIAALEREQEKLRGQIAAAQSAEKESKKTRDLYTQQINSVTKQIDLLDDRIAAVNKEIAQKDKAIGDIEAKIKANEQQADKVRTELGERIANVAKRGNFTALQMLMGADNYTDYLVKAKLMEKIAQHDQTIIDALKAQIDTMIADENKVKEERSAIEAKKAEIETLRTSSNKKKIELNSLYTKANAAYKKDKAETAALNKELEQTENDIRKLLNSTNSTGSYTATSMFWPVPTVRAVSSYFGPRWNTTHKGIDIANGSIPVYGQNIVAAANGTVIYANKTSTWGGGYGYYTMIDHGLDSKGRQIVTLYAHCKVLYVSKGQKVVGGSTVIGQAGKTGNVTGPHLHFEVRENGVPVDPIKKGYVSVNGK